MSPPKDYTGHRFGLLVAIKRIPFGVTRPSGKKQTTYICQCDCGEVVERPAGVLVSGWTRSCGCLRKIKNRDTKRKKPFSGAYRRLLYYANRSGKTCSITYEDFLEFTKIEVCEYCGDRIKWEPYSVKGEGKSGTTYFIDRKDNEIGYEIENCVVCCPRCNWGKSDLFTYEEWKFMQRAER